MKAQMEGENGLASNSVDGIAEIKMQSWEDFMKYINNVETVFEDILFRPSYIWRGQANEKWELVSSLDRRLRELQITQDRDIRKKHLDRFRMAIRGKISEDLSVIKDSELWSIGQHYGLRTPLLDWTTSPYIAAYFAFEKSKACKNRAVFALNKGSVENKINEIKEGNKDSELEVVQPLMNYNSRLVNQGGLFIQLPHDTSLEKWVQHHFKGSKEPILIKFIIPETEYFTREVILTMLNRMNINPLSLFPDLIGSSKYCNLSLEKNYY